MLDGIELFTIVLFRILPVAINVLVDDHPFLHLRILLLYVHHLFDLLFYFYLIAPVLFQ
jgi:hypothetical protein